MSWVEDTGKRSAKAKHFYDSATGQWKAELAISDVHYKDGNDAWQEVNENLVDDGVGGYAKKCETTRHSIRLGNGGTRLWYPRRNVTTEYVALSNIQYYTNRWRNLNLPTPVWSGNGADWDMANLSAELVNTWRQIKTSFVLKDATAPTRLRFELAFTGLTFSTEDWSLTSTTDGEKWGFIPPPTFTDANNADVPVTTTWDGTYLEWSLDTTGATYPLTSHSVTFTDGYGGDVTTAKDTYLRSTNSDAAYGSATELISAYIWLIEFDLSSIEDTATCDSATLSFFVTFPKTSNRTGVINELLVANDNWVEGVSEDPATAGQSTWDYKSQTGSGEGTAWAGSAGASTADTDFDSTVLGTVSYTANDPEGTELPTALTAASIEPWFAGTHYGLRIIGTTLPNVASSDHGTTGYRPKLVVLYTAAGGGSKVPLFMRHYRNLREN